MTRGYNDYKIFDNDSEERKRGLPIVVEKEELHGYMRDYDGMIVNTTTGSMLDRRLVTEAARIDIT